MSRDRWHEEQGQVKKKNQNGIDENEFVKKKKVKGSHSDNLAWPWLQREWHASALHASRDKKQLDSTKSWSHWIRHHQFSLHHQQTLRKPANKGITMGIESILPVTLVQVTVQADWTDVVADVLRLNSTASFWVSCYKRGVFAVRTEIEQKYNRAPKLPK